MAAPPGGGGAIGSKPGVPLFWGPGVLPFAGPFFGCMSTDRSGVLELGVTPRLGVTGSETAPRLKLFSRKDGVGVNSAQHRKSKARFKVGIERYWPNYTGLKGIKERIFRRSDFCHKRRTSDREQIWSTHRKLSF